MLQLKWPLLALAGALALPSEDLVRTASEGQTVERTFRHASEMELDEVSMTFDGEQRPIMGGMDMEEEVSRSSTLRVRDAVKAVEGDRASLIERTFVELRGETSRYMLDPMGEERSEDAELRSDLEGLAVELEGDDQEFSADWAEGSDGDDEALEGLTMSMDLEVLLPGEVVEEGASWEVSVDLLDQLRDPAGDVGLTSGGAEGGLRCTDEGRHAGARGRRIHPRHVLGNPRGGRPASSSRRA